jgi:hypothetical protein
MTEEKPIMASNLENRIVKLELVRGATRGYVIRLSDPPTSAELAEIAAARTEGRRHIIAPHPITTSEWLAKYGHMRLPR